MLAPRSAFVCLIVFHALGSAVCQEDTVCSYIVTMESSSNPNKIIIYKKILDCCQGYSNFPLCEADCSQLCWFGECTAPELCNCFSGWTGPSCDIDINECEVSNGGCAHICLNSMGSYSCECNSGYIISGGEFTSCEDLNECDSNNGDCDHQCHNTNGSYYCSCDPLYSLQSDGKTCLLVGTSASPSSTLAAQPESEFTSYLVPELFLAMASAILIGVVITLGAMIVMCIMLKRKDADRLSRPLHTSMATSRLIHRSANRPNPSNSDSSLSPPPYTFIPLINPSYEIRTSILSPARLAANTNLASMNRGRNFSQLSSGVQRLNPLYEEETFTLAADESVQ